MLKTIPTDQVILGMYIHSLKGDWIDHPFWMTKFVLQDPDDLKKLQSSVIKEVVIDIAKGVGVVELKAKQEPSVKSNTNQLTVVAPITQSVSAAQERAAAAKVIQASKKAVASMFNDVRMGKAIQPQAAMPLVEDIAASVTRNQGALISLVRLKNKDDYTYMHSVAVCALMVALAKELGLSEADTRHAGLAGLMHDIGKALIPSEVLNKPGALTEQEFALVKEHPSRGYSMLQEGQVSDDAVLDVCLHHHEKIDGNGYPEHLNGSQISVFAKMGAVCDVYDAVTSNRPYKAGWEPGISLQRMAQWKGHFDEDIFKAFVKSVGIYPIGSMVKLKSGLLAVVIDQSQKSLLKPIVKVFFSTKSRTRVPTKVLDLSKSHTKDEIVGHEDPVLWGIYDLQSIWQA